MADLNTYLQDGQFTVFAPGIDAVIELGKKNEKMDRFLDSKDSASNFFFITYNIFDDQMTYTDAESERIFLERNEDNEMELLQDAGDQGWRYYMAGFRPNQFGLGGLGGVIIVDDDFEKIKTFLVAKERNWFVFGERGGEAHLIYI